MAGPRPPPSLERDLTELAREGRLPPGYGIDEEVEVLLAMVGRGGPNLLLAGEPGVGKTARVHALARRIADAPGPGPLAGARLLELSVRAFLSWVGKEEEVGKCWSELVERLEGSGGLTVVSVRDGGAFLGTPLLASLGETLRASTLRFVLEADPRRARALMDEEAGLGDRLHLVTVPEPVVDRTRAILVQVAADLERQLGLAVDPGACDLALRLTDKFLIGQRQPGKSVELLRASAEEAGAAKSERLGPEGVLGRFCAVSQLPRSLVDDGAPLDLEQAEAYFNERILGQPEAVKAILRPMALLKAGLTDPRRPLGLFLCTGPTGVGKTHLARLLAEYVFGSAERLVRVNMADFPDEDDDAVLFGMPWTPSRDHQRGQLTRLLDGKLFAVLLLDEFEKAHRSVHDRCLQLFDEGQFINAANELVRCSNVLIIVTSNAGAEVYREASLGFAGAPSSAELVKESERRLAEVFRHELLNRFDAICHFRPLGKVEIRRIAQREVGRVLEREGIRTRGLDVEVAPEVIDLLVERGYSPLFGARFLQREIERTVTAPVAAEIVRRPLPPGSRIQVQVSGAVVTVRSEPRAEEEARTPVAVTRLGTVVGRRRLDRKALLEEASALAERAARVAESLDRAALEQRRADLLAQTQAPDLWDDPLRAAGLLRSFQALDREVQALDALLRGCESARRLVGEAKGEVRLAAAARAVERSAREVQLAEARVAAGGSGADELVLDLAAAQENDEHRQWLGELVAMYQGWASHRGYEATAMAESLRPPRVLLHLAGPGAPGFLAGEEGIHRRHQNGRRVVVRVRLLPWPNKEPMQGRLNARCRAVRRREGLHLERVTAELRGFDEGSGREVDLDGGVSLHELRALALLVLSKAPPDVEARHYFVGRAARVEDPRTGTATPRLKDVLRGEIEPFIAGWLGRAGG
ncbi:MAG TPA: AAA family ATPase [Myxococcaceae bacterium]|nr:AAA family ATPase [Myxococcaceae bacterium]